MRSSALIALFVVVCSAQTTVYLRDASSPEVVEITNAVDNGDYIRLTATGHGLEVGDKIAVQGVRGCWRANGTRTVAVVPDANTVDLLARDGTTTLDCGGTWVTPRGTSDGPGIGQAWLGELTSYTLKANPNIHGFDGPSGSFTTGLASRVSASDPAWVSIKANADALLSTYTTLNAYDAAWAGNVTSLAVVWHALGRDSGSAYLTAAKYLLNQAHRITGAPGCNESVRDCGRAGLSNDIDQPEYQLLGAAIAFSILYDELSAGERTAFAEKMLNDRGQNNSDETDCTNPFTWGSGTATGTAGTNTITVTPASAIAAVQVGDYVGWTVSTSYMEDADFFVSSKDDETGVITLSKNIASGRAPSSSSWFYVSSPETWDSSWCGYAWFQKHYYYNPGFVPAGDTPGSGFPYPTHGAYAAGEASNLNLWRERFYFDVGAATCPVDARGCELYERAQAHFVERTMPWFKNFTSGMTAAGSSWYKIRVEAPIAEIAWSLNSQLTPAIDVTGGNWLKQILAFSLYQLLPGQTRYQHTYGERNDLTTYAYSRQGDLMLAGALSGETETEYWRHWLKNVWTGYTEGTPSASGYWGMVAGFLSTDYLGTTTDYTAVLPTQRIFGHPTDLDESWTGTALDPNGFLGAISKSSWDSTATSIFTAPQGIFIDHAYTYHLGHYQIYKGNWLYGDTESTTAIGSCSGTTNCFGAGSENTSTVEIGAPTSATATDYNAVGANDPRIFEWSAPTNRHYLSVKRWAGDDFAGRSDSAYAYLMFDASTGLNTTYTGTVNRQNYHYLHMKGGGRDYLLRYVDTSLGSSKRMRTYLHFPNNGQTGEGYTSSDASGVIRTSTNADTSMHSTVLLPATLAQTDVHAVRTSTSVLTLNANASETYPVRHLNGGVSCEYTAPATLTATVGTSLGYVYVWIDTSDCSLVAGYNSSGMTGSGVTVQGSVTSFPGSGAYPVAVWNLASSGWATSAYVRDALPHSAAVAARRYVVDLGTDTASEYLVLHEPHGDAVSSATAATVTTTTGWQTVQIAHATLPAVAAFSRAANQTSWSYTSTHDGNAQYVIAGLDPGTYEVTLDSAEISGSPFTVTAGDNTVTWTGAAGVYALGDVPPITLSTDQSSLSFSSTVGGSDPAVQTVTASCAGGSCTAAVAESCDWLEVTGAGATPATLTFTPSISGLSAGTQECSVSVSAEEATIGSPATVTVTLAVSDAPAAISTRVSKGRARIK